ncbi:MAG: hypothetical protein GXP08_00655 [Gammaproteobacteria bacterium]|nr:hypothetical protein [Gammaproteobacteria bacterium]
MRLVKLTVWLGLMCFACLSKAEEGEFAVGLAALNPSGLTAKYWVSDTVAYDALAEWSFDSSKIEMHADYLIHDFTKLPWEAERTAVYYGYGVKVRIKKGSDTTVAIRIPIGASYFIDDMPFEVFGEVAPRVRVVPSTNASLDLIIGIRYRFLW